MSHKTLTVANATVVAAASMILVGSAAFNTLGYVITSQNLTVTVAQVTMTLGLEVIAFIALHQAVKHMPMLQRLGAVAVFAAAAYGCLLGGIHTATALNQGMAAPVLEAQALVAHTDQRASALRTEIAGFTDNRPSDTVMRAAESLAPTIAARRIEMIDQARAMRTAEDQALAALKADLAALDTQAVQTARVTAQQTPPALRKELVWIAELVKALALVTLLTGLRPAPAVMPVQVPAADPEPVATPAPERKPAPRRRKRLEVKAVEGNLVRLGEVRRPRTPPPTAA
jgi:hypothetical protein